MARAGQQGDAEGRHRLTEPPLTGQTAGSAEWPPLCGEEEFGAVIQRMVADGAPGLFAVVAEYGDRADAVIAAWGLAFDDHAEVVSEGRGVRLSVPGPQEALTVFSGAAGVRPRLVWFDPAAVSPGEDEPDPLAEARFAL